MFTIMENRKRPRLELITNNNNNSHETIQGVASTTTAMGSTATLATIGGQSYILSNGSSTALPANILLSICDDNSDESEEYIIESPMLTHIKQENTVATQTNSNQTSSQLPALVSSLPQYRIVNQAGKCLNNTSLTSTTLVNSNATVATNNSSTLLSNSVHLPPGCEIYVIKEVIDNPKQILQNESVLTNKGLHSNTTIKLEPMPPLPILRNSTNNTTLNCNTSQNLIRNNNDTQISITTTPSTTINTSSSVSSVSSQDETIKRSLILEAYKKRDDKRRATHNEVERRRRDKINSWIFKLKEMLPTDVTPPNGSTILNKEAITAATALANNQNISTTQQQQQHRLLVQQQATTSRTPPSDSKSQILIKACEYIKSMQEEIKSLRECLTENENLRLCNQRLQDEINTLRSKQQLKQQLNNNIIITTTTNNTNNSNNNIHNTNNSSSNNSNNINDDDDDEDCEITLNTLNATYANVQLFAPTTQQQQQNSNNQQHHHLAGLMGLTTNSNATSSAMTTPATVNVTYAKRELIITDYVD